MRIMVTKLAAVAAILSIAAAAAAQDPTQSLPDAYSVQLENDFVKVIRVHYAAGAKLPEHTHQGGTTAYVYLNDSEGVVFQHHGNNNRAVTRPAVKTGGMRIAAGQEEHHSAENPASTPSDFLRIVFKTDDGGVSNLRQRLAPSDAEFANKQMRISRLRIEPGQKTLIEAKNSPALRIAIRQGIKEWTPPPPDLVRWLDKGTTEEFEVTGDFAVDIIRIDFLTKAK
jgi:hypothetical protein